MKVKHFSILAFLICGVYWFYLGSMAEMVIAHDAVGYERLGYLLNEHGWTEYFRTGPNREPLYPWLISFSIFLGKTFSVSYQTIQIIFQMACLWLTQFLTLKILREFNIRESICALVILYLGFSPAIINSTFILYSEIITYPLVILNVWLNWHIWKKLENKITLPDVVIYGLLLALSGLSLVFSKAVFEVLFLFLLIPYLFLINKSKHVIVFLTVCSLAFVIPVSMYKSLNLKYNGNFALTDRGAWALYGQTARRMEPLNTKRLSAAVAFTPSWGFCLKHFSPAECQDWSFIPSDELGAQKRGELNQAMPIEKVNGALIKASIDKILSNPLQYGLLTAIESFKMFFWEEAAAQYVIFPKKIISLYSSNFFKRLVNTLGFLITLGGMSYLIWTSWRDRKNFLTIYIFLFIFGYVSIHSFFYILPRYILPIVPLYLIAFAALINLVFDT